MAKFLLFLCVGSLSVLASCNSDNNIYRLQQARIDSTVNAIVSKHDAENVAKKDSTLNAIEKQKADSITKQKELEEKKQPVEKTN